LGNSNTGGIEFKVPNGSGLLTLGEVGLLTGQNRGVAGLPGVIKAGAYYDSERLTDLDSGRNVDGTWGMYILGEYMLYSENNQYTEGLSGFLALSYGPENRNIITFMASGGLSYQGLIPNRSDDTLAFVFAYGLFSDDQNEFNRENGDPNQSSETY
jgi:porin